MHRRLERFVSVRESLLALLASGPRHGYQLKSEFEARTAGVWALNIGQVYSTLERLERDGLVVGCDADAEGRRAFDLTAAGRDELDRYLRTPGGDEAPTRDGLMMKVLIAVDTEGVDSLQVIQAERAARMGTLQARRRDLREANVNGELAKRLAFDALIATTESELRWLDMCEERILDRQNHQLPSENGHAKEHA
jgi:DNA-binding PadR family transcriptional regulator